MAQRDAAGYFVGDFFFFETSGISYGACDDVGHDEPRVLAIGNPSSREDGDGALWSSGGSSNICSIGVLYCKVQGIQAVALLRKVVPSYADGLCSLCYWLLVGWFVFGSINFSDCGLFLFSYSDRLQKWAQDKGNSKAE